MPAEEVPAQTVATETAAMSTCARCGHTTPTCQRFRDHEFCHTFSTAPSCYTQQQWEDTAIREWP